MGVIIIITRQFVEEAIKNNYPYLIKNIYSKNYDFHTQIIKSEDNTKFKMNIFDEKKVLYTIIGVIELKDIDNSKKDFTKYYKYIKITDDIPKELAFEQNLECFLCKGTGKIDPIFSFIEDFQKILKNNTRDELIQMIKILRNQNINLMEEIKELKNNK